MATASLALPLCGHSQPLPQLAPAVGANLVTCSDLKNRLVYPNTQFSAASAVAAGGLRVAGVPVPAHCLLTGSMDDRVSPVDGKSYAIGFEMRLPNAWNGRFFYQANGGSDGYVSTASGGVGGAAGPTSALGLGFAVISSDAGHNASQNPTFGIDPQARLDYGYEAVGKLTPMAKTVLQTAYGKPPDRSYLGGCSNGGRHALVAASRYSDQYDGILAGDPGWRLPLAAIADIEGYQTYARLATDPHDVSTGFTVAERRLVATAVAARCDALDGAVDGQVLDINRCQAAFNLQRDVPTCSGARDGTCLSSAQKTGIGHLFSGATTGSGKKFYACFPYDTGIATSDWGTTWKFGSPPTRDAGSVAFIWQVPPADPATYDGTTFAASSKIDSLLTAVNTTNATYTESALSFMLPPHPSDLSVLKDRGAKLMIFHGTSDPIFSSDDSVAYLDALGRANGGDASNFARLYLVAGMNHCNDGPSTDQFDMLTPLVNWVEHGLAPDSVQANVRGKGNAAGVNADVPTTWSPTRSRPLCSYPHVARYNGSGDIESAASFSCE